MRKYTDGQKTKFQEQRRAVRRELDAAAKENRVPVGVLTLHRLDLLREYEDHAQKACEKLKRPYKRITVSKTMQAGPETVMPTEDPPVKVGAESEEDTETATGAAAPDYQAVKQAFGAGAVKGRFVCDACGKDFTTEEEAGRHIALEHTSVHDNGTAWEPPSFREVVPPPVEPEKPHQAQPGANGAASKPTATKPKPAGVKPPFGMNAEALAKVGIQAWQALEHRNRACGFGAIPDELFLMLAPMVHHQLLILEQKGWNLDKYEPWIIGAAAVATTVQTVRANRDGGRRLAEMQAAAGGPVPEPEKPAPVPPPVQQQRDTVAPPDVREPPQKKSNEAYVAGPSKVTGV